MKPLTYRAALACENATHPRCRCRCGGALHGSARALPEELPPDDPHHAERPPEDPQTSLLEALDTADVLERLDGARARLKTLELEEEAPSEEEVEAWLAELRDFATRGVRAQRAVDAILEERSS